MTAENASASSKSGSEMIRRVGFVVSIAEQSACDSGTRTTKTFWQKESYRRKREGHLAERLDCYSPKPRRDGSTGELAHRRPLLTAILDLGEFMSYFKYLRALGVAAGLTAAACTTNAQEIKKVFVIAMENHNWTQPANQFTGGIKQIYLNPNAPFINSVVNG